MIPISFSRLKPFFEQAQQVLSVKPSAGAAGKDDAFAFHGAPYVTSIVQSLK